MWLLVDASNNGSIKARSSRSRGTKKSMEPLVIKRNSDHMVLRVGDSIEIDDMPYDVGLITDIEVDLIDQFTIQVLWYYGKANVTKRCLKGISSKKPLFLSPVYEYIPLGNIKRKVLIDGSDYTYEKLVNSEADMVFNMDFKEISSKVHNGRIFMVEYILDQTVRGHKKRKVDGSNTSTEENGNNKMNKKIKVDNVKEGKGNKETKSPRAQETEVKETEVKEMEVKETGVKETDEVKETDQVKEGKENTEEYEESRAKPSEAIQLLEDTEVSKETTAKAPVTLEAVNESLKETGEVDAEHEQDNNDSIENDSDYQKEDRSEEKEEEEDIQADDDDDFEQPKKKKKTRGRKPSKSPKRKYKKQSSELIDESDDEKTREIDQSLLFMQKIVSGFNGFKVQSALPVPNFGALTKDKKRKTNKTSFEDYELLDTSSNSFKELKKKLHTATKLASLPCREDEFTSLYLSIESSIREQTGCCLYVSGTPGIGKTATIREVMSQMKELHQLGEIEDFKFVEINALKLITPAYAYTTLWRSISGVEVSPPNAALFLEAYFKEASDKKKPIVVMVDELDQIASKTQNVMYNFFNWPTYPSSKLIVLAVANTMDLPERVLSNKISSRLGLKRIQFIGYTYEQLGQIIEHRLDLLTKQLRHKVVVDKDAINFASRKVASVSGDARKALQICRRAVEIAEGEYKKSTSPEAVFHVKIPHIAKAINETINSPIAQYVSTLSFGSKLILCAVLLRMRRSGLGDNPLGDIIEEMNGLLRMATAKDLKFLTDKVGPIEMVDALLEGNLFDQKSAAIRIEQFRYLFFELVENGVLNSQDLKSEIHRIVLLNSSQEEISTILKRDPLISTFL